MNNRAADVFVRAYGTVCLVESEWISRATSSILNNTIRHPAALLWTTTQAQIHPPEQKKLSFTELSSFAVLWVSYDLRGGIFHLMLNVKLLKIHQTRVKQFIKSSRRFFSRKLRSSSCRWRIVDHRRYPQLAMNLMIQWKSHLLMILWLN